MPKIINSSLAQNLCEPSSAETFKSLAWKVTCQKFLKAQCDIPIPIIIISLENIRHSLQNYAALHEQVETHVPFSTLVISCVEQVYERRRQAVAKLNERFRVLIERYVPAVVFVESIKECPPGGEETP